MAELVRVLNWQGEFDTLLDQVINNNDSEVTVGQHLEAGRSGVIISQPFKLFKDFSRLFVQ